MKKEIPPPDDGGSYEIKNGKRVLVEQPTRDHPDGNRARQAGEPPTAAVAPTEEHE